MRIACIGDSCTFGQNVRSDQAWPHLLWEMTGHDVRNLGVNGDTSRLGLERWHRDVELSKPDIVVIQFGHNDVNLWDGFPRVSVAAYASNIAEMAGRAFTFAKRVFVITPHEATGKDDRYNERLRIYKAAIDLLNIRDRTPDLETPLLDDGYGVHPNPEGHRVYAEHVAGLL